MKVISARLALAFATFLSLAELARNMDVVQWWPFWVVDYLAVALLLWGAAANLWSPGSRNLAPLTAAWGFTAAMFWMSLFGHIQGLQESGVPASMSAVDGPASEPVLTMIIGVLFLLSVAGLVSSLLAARERN